MIIILSYPGGYKGYGLGMMVEVFCGILSGASYGPKVRRWKGTEREANLVMGLSYQLHVLKLLQHNWAQSNTLKT